jgi:hypothetical protein
MRKNKSRWRRFAYGLGILLRCIQVIVAQCNGSAHQISTLTPLQGYITSPGYPKNYANGLRCLYDLNAPLDAGLVIQMSLVDLDLIGPYSESHDQCLQTYLVFAVIDRSGREHLSQRYCGQPGVLPVLNTLQSQARVIFVSGDAAGEQHRGFKIYYSFVTEGKCKFVCGYR